MAVYGKKYSFSFTSQNGAYIEIDILQEGYIGEVMSRPLGRAPMLKRESNGCIYGTSLEIYAEAQKDGEYSSLYTSHAEEYQVRLYRNYNLEWIGYVTPELYSEPDIAPPYDVQIIATDGLGELRNSSFVAVGSRSIRYHLDYLLSRTGLYLNLDTISTLEGSLQDALDVSVNLDHLSDESCYDVLQLILSSLHATITQNSADWLLVRETDLSYKIVGNKLVAESKGAAKELPIGLFGSANDAEWWPIGMLSSTVVPARKRLAFRAENAYTSNILDWAAWSGGPSLDSETNTYTLQPNNAINQKITFPKRLSSRLQLTVKARCEGGLDAEPNLGISVKIHGLRIAGEKDYWLFKSVQTTNRKAAPYVWMTDSARTFTEELDPAQEGATERDAKEIKIVIPIYYNTPRDYTYANDIEISVYNPNQDKIILYDIALAKYEQIAGYETVIDIQNGAREEGERIDLCILSKTAQNYNGAEMLMYGVPTDAGQLVNSWSTANFQEQEYSHIMALDYAASVALPRVNITGILNVPDAGPLPMLFFCHGIYYLLERYSYNLYDDELDMSLLSIPSAEVSVDNIVEVPLIVDSGNTHMGASGGSSGTGGAGGEGGSVTVDTVMSDTSANAVQNKVIKSYVDSQDAKITAGLGTLSKINMTTDGGKFLMTTGGSSAVWVSMDKSRVGLNNVENTAFYARTTFVNDARWYMAGTDKGNAFTIYAPVDKGANGQILVSKGDGAPEWKSQAEVLSLLGLDDIVTWVNAIKALMVVENGSIRIKTNAVIDGDISSKS